MTATLTPPAGQPAHYCVVLHQTVMGAQNACKRCNPRLMPPPKKAPR